ncbi:amidohydrolase family protein [Amycolatopsis sp. GM8]|uniref:amidohydrolase family protein n=1 Tax=Amycolatopsis sp. GM8 TaxID=2896530 RepID=UPI001F25997D|nr:amidohydrolase family protein [Amycolatopsis sp. GM8]
MGFIALTNVNIFLPYGYLERPGQTLLIKDENIYGVYDSLQDARLVAAGEVAVLDAAQATILPGFIDAHVHLFFNGGRDMISGIDRDVAGAARRAVAHLQAGVTTVRDLGAPSPEIYFLKERASNSGSTLPRLLAAGPLLTIPNGHGHFVGRVVKDEADIVDAISELSASGVDCIKFAVSGGVSTPGSDLTAVQFNEPELRRGVHVAHDLGLRVAAHASNANAVRISAAAGVDTVEHAVMIDEPALDELVANNTILVPTLTATDLPSGFLEDENIPRYIRDKVKIVLPAHRESIARAVSAGVVMAAGTDAGSTATPHGRVANEARQLVGCGLTNREAIEALTSNAAQALGVADRVGTIEAGRVADLVGVKGNPLVDIGSLQNVVLVIKNGSIARSP